MQVSFDKCLTTGVYHWAERSPLNWQYNATLMVCCRSSVLRRSPAAATRILDAGCGDDHLTYLIAKPHSQALITGIDHEESGIRQANVMTARTGIRNLEFHHVRAGATPFRNAEVTEHLPEVP